MWMGQYGWQNLFGLLIQTIFIQNILLFYFLGMCSYLACSNRLSTAKGLGLAVTVVMTGAGVLNWLVHNFITKKGALSWLGFDASEIDLSFLELLLFISVIAAFVQILEMVIDKFSPTLYASLGVYLPLITVNCAILGATLFAVARSYPFFPNLVFSVGSGIGWWLAIVLIATLRDKMKYSDIPKNLQGMAITFIVTGLMAIAFMGFAGISLGEPIQEEEPISAIIEQPS